ncbi:MAG: cobyrinate a,c-diamide synthase [Acetatifactor sp.]|nr:cobyrinate a,c-diamide synthase [Acetatifactor sp.]
MRKTFMIAATKSGAGKTSITCAILKALKDRGVRINSYKCGPDYIDPMFHRSVIGIPSKNLDLFFCDEENLREVFDADGDAEVSVVEGVMGLYDGINPSSDDGSSYNIACALDIPIVLVVDAHGMGRSLLALIKGFKSMDRENRIRGIILNRISKAFYETIKPVIEKECGISVVGYVPKSDDLSFESRHLGLMLPGEVASLNKKLSGAAGLINETVDLDFLTENMAVQRETVTETVSGKEVKASFHKPLRLAVARDEAFCFYYEENYRALREAGFDIVEFSPIHDKSLPENIRGLLLGGGYPENYAEALSKNKSMLKSIKDAITGGLPSLAECGGFMYLHRKLITKDGEEFALAGVIDGTVKYTGHLVRFGYVTLTDKYNKFFESGTDNSIKGHEFHYYDSTDNGSDALCTKPVTGKSWEASHIGEDGKNWWGFAHLYYPSNPLFIKRFADICKNKMMQGDY